MEGSGQQTNDNDVAGDTLSNKVDAVKDESKDESRNDSNDDKDNGNDAMDLDDDVKDNDEKPTDEPQDAVIPMATEEAKDEEAKGEETTNEADDDQANQDEAQEAQEQPQAQEQEEEPQPEQEDATTNTPPSSSSATASSEDRINESIYDHILRTACVQYACNMHKLIKTGKLAPIQLRVPTSRLQLYPQLYQGNTTDEIQKQMETYATEVPLRKKQKIVKKKNISSSSTNITDTEEDGGAEYKDDEDETTNTNTANNPTTNPQQALSQPTNHLDIWGRIPPKEPKNTCECKVCGRHVSALRFASHLDKCMGLSTRPSSSSSMGNASRGMM